MPPVFLALVLLLAARPISAQFPAEVCGRVVDATGGGVTGAVVEVPGIGLRVRAEAGGAFELRGLLPGRREIRASAAGYVEARVVVEVRNGSVSTLRIVLQPAPVRLQGVTVRGSAAAGGALVIDREQIEASGARDAGELLAGQPGVTVVRHGGPGSPATVSIRGSGADEVLVLLDGLPLNSPLTGEADLSTVPPEVLECVTVLRGAQSARYGAQAMAGVVLLDTRRPVSGELSVRSQVGSWAERSGALSAGERVRIGGWEASWLLVGEGRGTVGNFRYSVPRVRGGGTAVRRNADSRSADGVAQAALRRGETEVGLRLEGLGLERGMPGSIVQPSPGARQGQTRRAASARLRLRAAQLAWRLDVDTQEQRAAYRDSAPPLGPAYDESANARTLGATASASGEWGRWRATAGAEARLLTFRSSMVTTDAPARQWLGGAWAQLGGAWPLASDWMLDATAALRADRGTHLSGITLSPRATASLSGHHLTTRLSLGNAFSPPSLADQFFQEGVLARPNPALRPERARGELEAGVDVRDLPLGTVRLQASAAAFRADVDGMILWFPNHRFVWQPDNFDVRRRGWDLALEAALPGPGIALRGQVSRADVEYAGPVLSGQVRYRPRLTAGLTAAARAAGVQAELSTRFVGERRTVPGSPLNALPSYTLTDARLTRRLTVRGWAADLTLAAENLFDLDAAMLVDYPFPGRSWSIGARIRRSPRGEATPAAQPIELLER